jgi:hypothetical protein
MKKLLLATLVLSGIAVFAPRAEAGSYRTVRVGYDHCGRPVYRQVVSRDYCAPRYYSHSAPVYHRSSGYRSYNHYRCDDRRYYSGSRYYSSRPRIAVSFGF